VRRSQKLPPPLWTLVCNLSGGPPGLILALFDALLGQEDDATRDWTAWCLSHQAVQEECRKLWVGLAKDERIALSHVQQGLGGADHILRVLALKGLYRADQAAPLFSPLFAQFILTQAAPVDLNLWIDEDARVVWLGQRQVPSLTRREFDLLALLFRHAGHVCTHDQILSHLYPDDVVHNVAVADERIAAIVKRLRKKIEPMPGQHRFILTVRDKGYKLAAD
jgi:hypothetical protein